MIKWTASAAAVLALATGCSSSGGTATTSPATGGDAGGVTISLSQGHLVAPDGRTLYDNTADTATHAICTGKCLSIWPPVLGRPVAGSGVAAGSLGTVERGGKAQVTFDGHPLYEFASDSGPGDTKGDGVTDAGGTWHPAGSSAGGGPASAPATKSGGGYNYP